MSYVSKRLEPIYRGKVCLMVFSSLVPTNSIAVPKLLIRDAKCWSKILRVVNYIQYNLEKIKSEFKLQDIMSEESIRILKSQQKTHNLNGSTESAESISVANLYPSTSMAYDTNTAIK